MDFLARLEHLMTIKGVNKAQVAAGAGLGKTTVYAWWDKGYEGITLPKLKALCAYFGCTLDYLVCGDEAAEQASLTPDENRLLSVYRSMSKDGKEKVLTYASDMLVIYQAGESKAISSNTSIA